MYMNPTINPQATGLQVFYNSETGINLRTQVVNNESWFIAQDICNILGLNNITKAMAALDFVRNMGLLLVMLSVIIKKLERSTSPVYTT